MEDCRFETSELHASFLISTSLLSDSWSLCNAAKSTGSIQIQQVAGITYVALPTVPMEMIQLGDLVSLKLKVDGDELFPGLVSDEPPPMVDNAILKLFLQLKIKEELKQKLVGKKLVVITGHSTGGALAALTTLWLLSQTSSPSFHLLCITFGSHLLGNQSLSTSISRSRLAHKFYHVVSIHDHVPRSSNDQFWPFGTYLFCSDNGGVCLDNAASVCRMFLLLNTTRTPNIEEQESYQAGVALAVEALGFSNSDASGVSVKECIEAATRIGRDPILRSAELANELANVLPARLEIQWYKDRCDASIKEEFGYYDFFKRYSLKRDFKVNLSRIKLAKFWDKVVEMVETKKLPFDFHLSKKWVYASQFYQLLAEPLDIAYFYKDSHDGHYMDQGKREKRYVVLDKWFKQTGERENSLRSTYASATQDSCFWARLEEAKECLDELTREDIDEQRRSFLWEKIVRFESHANTLVANKDVSKDVLARRSSYRVWVENLSEFKFRMGYGNGNQMAVDEIDEAMET
ncbi:Lipase-like PAD4 [Cardamine amara subsp. amara]|uniref:Lipase-like PAD4 n=1 Tax=Cardamine amara subsp. amara TaxID=228776 RepID=A0ABD0ZZB5_CARAN